MTEPDKPHDPGKHESDKHELGRGHPAAGAETNHRDVTARSEPAKPAAREGEPLIPPEQASTEPSSPPHLGGKMVNVIIGPMRGHALIMPEAEADQAINDHWAVDPHATLDPDHDPHDPLTDAEREAAEAAAIAWSEAAHNPEPEPPPVDPPDPPEGLRRTVPDRGMRPAEGGDYLTRGHPEPKPEPKRSR